MRIRAARGGDLAAVEGIVQRAYEPYIERIGRRPAPMDDDYAEAIADGHVFLAEESAESGGNITGLLVLIPADDHLLVENVAVDPVRQGKGLGRALLSRAESVARKRGLPALRLYTNAAMHENIALYSSLGWQETERRRVSGFERVFFHKPLDQVADMLALLGTGGAGEVLLALGEEELRTEELVERIGVYSPRTIYRYLDRLVGLEVVEREEEPGVPSKVTNRLTEPRGAGLYEVVGNYARVSLDHLPDGRVVTHSWSPLAGLADLWRSGMLEALNAGPRTVTELAQASPSLSFHQVGRRMSLYVAADLLEVAKGGARRRCYRPTEYARRGVALVAGLARWREGGEGGRERTSLTAAETASLVAASLPLAVLPEAAGKRFKLAVRGRGPKGPDEEALVWAKVGTNGAFECLPDGASADASASGTVDDWLCLMTLGRSAGLRVDGGDGRRLAACLKHLHVALWKRPAPST